MEVVEHQDDGAGAGQPGEQPPHRPERLLRRRRRARAEQAGGAVDDPVALGLVVGDERRDPLPDHVGWDGVADAGGGAQRLRDRGERGEPAGVAPARQHGGAVADAPVELVEQAGLPEAGRAQHHREAGAAGRDAVERSLELLELRCPPDQARGRARDRRVERHQPVRRDQLGAALELQVAGGLERQEAVHQPPRRVPEDDLAQAGVLLQARRHVHRVADDVVVGGAHHHLTGVDPDAEAEVVAETGPARGDRAEAHLHLVCGPHRPEGVVLADVRHSEHRHHAVAEQLHDRAVVVVDRPPHRGVVAVHQLAGRLRVEPLLERGRAGEIREHDRDDLAGVVALRRRRRGQRRPAGIAEPRALTVRPATVVTRHPGPPSAPDPCGRC